MQKNIQELKQEEFSSPRFLDSEVLKSVDNIINQDCFSDKTWKPVTRKMAQMSVNKTVV